MGRENRHGIHLTQALKWLTRLTYSIPKSWLTCLESGGREGIRTLGLLVANEALSQLSYSPPVEHKGLNMLSKAGSAEIYRFEPEFMLAEQSNISLRKLAPARA